MRTTKEQYQAIHEAFNQVSGKQQLDEISGMDALHVGLDLFGMVPGVGVLADLANAGIYTARGKKGMAGLSLLAAVPGVGQAATAGKLATKFGGRVGKAARAISPTGKTAKAAEKATKVAKVAKKKMKKAKRKSRRATDRMVSNPSQTNVRAATRAGRKAATKRTAATAAKQSAKVAQKSAARTARSMKVINPAFKLATRAGVLGRGNVAQTYGFADPKTPAKDVQFGIPFTGGRVPGEGAAAVDKLTSGIIDTLRKGVKGLEGTKLGSFQG